MGVHLDDTNSRLATESSDLEEEDNGRGGDGDDLDSEPDNDSEASCEDASEYEESAPAAAVLNPQAVLPVNQGWLERARFSIIFLRNPLHF